MSKKSAKITALIARCQGQDLDAHYLGYFVCFNEGLFFEAHDVLEELWLKDRQGPNYSFHKGLIQLAGAYVHLQKNRLRPSAALFKLAQANLQKYPTIHESLDLSIVLGVITDWLLLLECNNFSRNPLESIEPPQNPIIAAAKTNMTTFLIATRNSHKVEEIRAILGNDFRFLTLRDFPGAPPVIEDAETFAGNATKKAVELARWIQSLPEEQRPKSPLWVMADDSGLEVDVLNGAPGVYSARFAALDTFNSANSPDADNNAKLLRLLNDVPIEKRNARFRCVIAITPVLETSNKHASPVCLADESEMVTELFDGVCDGHIALEPSGGNGFGYDPLFVPTGFNQSFAGLGEAVKNGLSHRAKALAKLLRFLATRN